MFILRIVMHLDNKIGYICCYLSLLSMFSYAFPPRAESATFLFATMLPNEDVGGIAFAILCLPNEDVGKWNSRSCVSFRGTLRRCEYSMIALRENTQIIALCSYRCSYRCSYAYVVCDPFVTITLRSYNIIASASQAHTHTTHAIRL